MLVAAANPPRHQPRRWRWAPWLAYAGFWALAPVIWPGSLALSLLSQLGAAVVACLAFNLLLGQGGMVSFGHALYSGLGGFAAVHALNRTAEGAIALPVSVVPLLAGACAAAAAALLGWVCIRRAGLPFAMITLGLGELAAAAAPMFPGLFGGEGGITANRVIGPPVLGVSFGPPAEMYALIACYAFASTAALFAWMRTPLGRLLNATRDNAERVAFSGHDPRVVRYMAFVVSGFFMGVSGGLAALHQEVASADAFGVTRSTAYLLFTVLGGTTVFWGPIAGAALMVLTLGWLSGQTQAWLLYLGLTFVGVVVFLPGGLAQAVAGLRRGLFSRTLHPVPAAALTVAACGVLLGLSALIEMAYHRHQQASLGARVRFLGLWLDSASAGAWLMAVALALAGALLFRAAWTRLAPPARQARPGPRDASRPGAQHEPKP